MLDRWLGTRWRLLACFFCLIAVGVVLGRFNAPILRAEPSGPVGAMRVKESVESHEDSGRRLAALGSDPLLQDGVQWRVGDDSSGDASKNVSVSGMVGTVRLAVATLSAELQRALDRLNESGEMHAGVETETSSNRGVLKEVSLWDDTARVRATYEIIDIDRLQERIGDRQTAQTLPHETPKAIGLNGEISFGNAGSLRVGYGLRHRATDRGDQLVGVADAEVAYRLGERTLLGADVEWGVSADGVEHAAGLNVSYFLAPNTSIRAGYHLLSFDDARGTKEYHNAAAGLQLRF